MAVASPVDPIWQLEAQPGQSASVSVFPSGSKSGYKFTVSRRPDGRLPVALHSYTTDAKLTLYVKLSNDKYGLFCDFAQPTRGGSGVLLPEGEYLYANINWGDKTVLASGRWISEQAQEDYWRLMWGGNPVETINLADGSTATALPFSVAARPNGALPYLGQRVSQSTNTIYKRLPSGSYAFYTSAAATEGWGILLGPGDYAYPIGAPPAQSPGDYTTILTGTWIVP